MFQNSTLYTSAATDEFDDEDVVIETESNYSRIIQPMDIVEEESSVARSVHGYIMLMRGVHAEATEEDVMDFLLDLGARPTDLRLPVEHATGRLKGYALVEYPTKEGAEKARVHFLTKPLAFMGRRLSMDYCFSH